MSGTSESEFATFKAQSDQAFFEMQRAADRAHAEFMQKYDGDRPLHVEFASALPEAALASAPAKPSYPVGPGPGPTPPARSSSPQPPEPAEKLYDNAPRLDLKAMSKESLDDSMQDARKDLGKLSASLREESRAAARDAMKGTSDILKSKSSGLGQKAKEEAARLKEAMQKAMEEERSLKAMKGRASEEVKKARSRMQQHLNETKEDAMGDITGMAKGAFDSLRGKANDAFEEGQNVMEREWKDFTSGQDS